MDRAGWIYITVMATVIGLGLLGMAGEKSIPIKTTATYSSTQIDNLIRADAALTNQIKQQLDYEQSFTK